ncbi:MAG: DUF2934 domain-containing protein [Candidatus Omnitrophica bacterium]|jgi:hypothetical protein|nr:DUF2934 domain-containing protein [Candidatus Omnitrophota bacterium]
MAKLDAKACGIAFGLVAAAAMFILGTINVLFFWIESYRRAVSILYLGYQPTVIGVIFGSLWAFIYAFILGSSFACLYNRIVEERKTEIDEKIKNLAHEIWVKKGKPDNSSDENWKEAVRRVRGD